MTYDSAQRFIDLVPGGQGIFYAIQSDGGLYWYRHNGWETGAYDWAWGSGRRIGTGWHQFTKVLAAQDGTLFALSADGTLRWYQYVLTGAGSGAGYWHPGSGTVIGRGFNRFNRFIGGWDNILYGLDSSGSMHWYRYTGAAGSPFWANGGVGKRIGGSGWTECSGLWADPNGVIYGARQGGEVRWWRYQARNGNGDGSWRNGGRPLTVGVGWGPGIHKMIFSNTSGTLYSVAVDTTETPTDDSTMTWYRLLTSETADTSGLSWSDYGEMQTVGHGFSVEASASIQGYPSTLSVPQGASVGVHVSCTFPAYTATVMREAPATSAGGAVVALPPATYPGRLQTLATGYRANGCNWAVDFTIDIPAAWPSGVYTARLTSPYGNMHPVMFVVRPAAPTAKIAVIIPTNTYNAYNYWAGHNQYSLGQERAARTITLRRPSTATGVTPDPMINASLSSDLTLLRWMTDENIAYDVYEDGDLDLTGNTWLSSYKAVVLASHPEYMTTVMRQNLVNYSADGGRIVYTGGNGVYEEMQFSADRSANIFRTPTGGRNTFASLGLPMSAVLGVAYHAASYMDFAPYKVKNNHALLNGTGLTVGSVFGTVAHNGGASGWEIDCAPTGSSADPATVVIASGLNPNGGADMTFTTKSNGGWVFTASSLSFNGALPYDAAIQQILRNVFAAAVI